MTAAPEIKSEAACSFPLGLLEHWLLRSQPPCIGSLIVLSPPCCEKSRPRGEEAWRLRCHMEVGTGWGERLSKEHQGTRHGGKNPSWKWSLEPQLI